MSTEESTAADARLGAESFEQVFDQHHAAVWRYLARLGGSTRADDLAGEVFTIAFARRATFDPALGEPRAWLYGIATNLLRTRMRSESRSTRAVERLQALEPPWSARPDDSTTVIERERLAAVLDALGQLSMPDRELIVLTAWEGLGYAEVADILGVPIGTVRSRLSRARARLRELSGVFGEEGVELEEGTRHG